MYKETAVSHENNIHGQSDIYEIKTCDYPPNIKNLRDRVYNKVNLNNAQHHLDPSETSDELERINRELITYKTELENMEKEIFISRQALSIFAKDMDCEKKEIEKKISNIVSNKIMPILKDLQNTLKKEKYRTQLDVLETYISNLIPSTENYNVLTSLTDMEMKISVMIRDGLSSHKITNLLYISIETVKTHRKNIRKKLNIQNSDINLATYLKSILIPKTH